MSIWSDIWDQIKLISDASSANAVGVATDLPSTPEGQAAIQSAGFFGFVEGLGTALTDAALYVSIAWILLGLLLMFSGARLWIGKSSGGGGGGPSVIPVPV